MNAAAPSSQAAGDRPISFLLTGDGGRQLAEPVTLAIRPESLTRRDPSRVSVTQTLGGAWADSFGAGLAQINISGNTGWRRGNSQATAAEDGIDRFLRLKNVVFSTWHVERAQAAAMGRDPSSVQLVFVDVLDNFACVVAPQQFDLQRSKSRPLLMQYQISMIVLSDTVGAIPVSLLGTGAASANGATQPDILRTLGLTSLADSVDKISAYAAELTAFIDNSIGAPVKAFMATTLAVYKRVDEAIKSVEGVADSLIVVARDASVAGANTFRTLALIASLPQRAKVRMMQVAAAYTNIFCLLSNSIKNAAQYDDYSNLYGASNCSSTSGGRPLSPFAGVNTFEQILPPALPHAVKLTAPAQAGLRTLAQSDVALAPLSTTSLLSAVQAVNIGMAVA